MARTDSTQVARPLNGFKLDEGEVYVMLSPAQVSILSCYANLYGPTPPPGVFNATWQLILKARTDAISCRELGSCVDAIGPELITALRAEEVVES